jgi:hypothetical protein
LLLKRFTRGDNLLQVVEFTKQLKDQIIRLENECEKISMRLEEQYIGQFQDLGVQLMIECIRSVKGKSAQPSQAFENNYESFIEIGIEREDEYFPNAYIPIWRCKKELFQETGYLTKYNTIEIEKKITLIIKEMLQEKWDEVE